MAKAVDVARYVLEQRDARGRLTSVSALQELLYVCQTWMLVAKNRPLFSDEITAGERSPVVKTVAPYCQGRRYVFPRDITGGNADGLALVERLLVDRVLVAYDETGDGRLGDMSRWESPWASVNLNETISLQSMLDYYSEIQANPNTETVTPIPNLADISDRTFISNEDMKRIGELLDDRTERNPSVSEKERRDSPHTEHATSAREYWDRLTRSFNADYMKTVEKKYATESDCS